MRQDETQQPKYEKVKNYVLTLIRNQEIVADERIPSESELAKALDVSSITVRKALSDLVNEGIIYRVRGKGSFVSRRPAAGENAAGKSDLVAFVISGIEMYDSSYMQIIKGVQSCLADHHHKLIIEFVENNIEQERDLVLKLSQGNYRGLLIYSSDPNAAKDYLREVQRQGVPFVLLDRFPAGYPVNGISCNNHDGAYEAVEYMINRGHRNIGIAAYDFHLSSEVERYNGYADAMANASLPLNPDIQFLHKELDYEQMASKIRSGAMTALFCVNDRRALEAIEQLTALGVKIPEEVSIMGFDDFETSKFAKVSLSTVKQYFDVLGHEAAALLLEVSRPHSYGYKKVFLPTSLVIRDTVAPPAAGAKSPPVTAAPAGRQS